MLEQENSGHFHNQIGNHCNYFLLSLLRKKYMNRQECIPVGCVLPAAVAVTGGLHSPLGANPPEQAPPEQGPPPEWTWSPPLGQIPLNFPLGCGPGDPPPSQIPLNFPLGVGLETCKVCWDTTPPSQRPAGRHAGIQPPPLRRPAARHAGIPPARHAGIPPPPEQNHKEL